MLRPVTTYVTFARGLELPVAEGLVQSILTWGLSLTALESLM
jgi:hypothetical protein